MRSVFARKGVFLLPMIAGLESSSFQSPKIYLVEVSVSYFFSNQVIEEISGK